MKKHEITDAFRRCASREPTLRHPVAGESNRPIAEPRSPASVPQGQFGDVGAAETGQTALGGQIQPNPMNIELLYATYLKTTRANPFASKTGWTTCKRGWLEIGGQRVFFRSKWEMNYARWLEFLKGRNEILSWEHEPETFWFEKIKRGVRSYLPDFRVTLIGGGIEYHEVKGWMDAKSKTKIKRMAKYYPKTVLVVRDSVWFRRESKVLRNIVPGWDK